VARSSSLSGIGLPLQKKKNSPDDPKASVSLISVISVAAYLQYWEDHAGLGLTDDHSPAKFDGLLARFNATMARLGPALPRALPCPQQSPQMRPVSK
jgi:hypothetical protein